MPSQSCRRHLLRVAEYQDAQRRIEPQIGLAHGDSQRITELFELAEGLDRGACGHRR